MRATATHRLELAHRQQRTGSSARAGASNGLAQAHRLGLGLGARARAPRLGQPVGELLAGELVQILELEELVAAVPRQVDLGKGKD